MTAGPLLRTASGRRIARHRLVMVLVAGPVLLSYLLEGVIAWADACLDLWRRWAGPSVGRQALLVVMAPVALAAILLDAIATWWRHGVAQWRAVA